ncbi:AfsR/SARP family transcriptional regulator [Rhizohabitans arisaemae]|uniref:AfsR/SARP family transcriptional regulator n=1 Tax=Rhizohabitans arisaemae TaxID=2720610 RepID=UPI0024B07E68|nr:BTAD domain-containing putative transcriptional regulator [Rhizohabitans arisaemae]
MLTATIPTVVARCMGQFRLVINDQQVAHWRAGKARALFQYLLINRGRLVHRDRLQEVLWPDSCDRGSSSLKVAVHAVRRILASYGADEDFTLVHQDHGYLLRAEGVWVDVDEFERAFQRGRLAWVAKDHLQALEWFRRAAELYTGDFLAGETGDWINEQRQWIRGIGQRALTTLRADALEREDWPEAMHWCRRILDLDPYHEDTYQTLMMMHGELGELGRVRDWYELCRIRLRNDLGIEPTDRTERIHTSLLRNRARTHLVAVAGAR